MDSPPTPTVAPQEPAPKPKPVVPRLKAAAPPPPPAPVKKEPAVEPAASPKVHKMESVNGVVKPKKTQLTLGDVGHKIKAEPGKQEKNPEPTVEELKAQLAAMEAKNKEAKKEVENAKLVKKIRKEGAAAFMDEDAGEEDDEGKAVKTDKYVKVEKEYEKDLMALPKEEREKEAAFVAPEDDPGAISPEKKKPKKLKKVVVMSDDEDEEPKKKAKKVAKEDSDEETPKPKKKKKEKDEEKPKKKLKKLSKKSAGSDDDEAEVTDTNDEKTLEDREEAEAKAAAVEAERRVIMRKLKESAKLAKKLEKAAESGEADPEATDSDKEGETKGEEEEKPKKEKAKPKKAEDKECHKCGGALGTDYSRVRPSGRRYLDICVDCMRPAFAALELEMKVSKKRKADKEGGSSKTKKAKDSDDEPPKFTLAQCIKKFESSQDDFKEFIGNVAEAIKGSDLAAQHRGMSKFVSRMGFFADINTNGLHTLTAEKWAKAPIPENIMTYILFVDALLRSKGLDALKKLFVVKEVKAAADDD